MALVVEDGTGKSNADSFVSLADFKTYCDNRGYDYSASSDSVMEQKLRLASDYISSKWKYKGTRYLAGQSLEFPRTGLYDDSSYVVSGVPLRVRNAACELAFTALTESLFENLDRGGKVTSESVGPISVSYAADAPAGKVFSVAEALLSPFIRTVQRDRFAPGVAASQATAFAESDPGYFKLGGMDNVAEGSDGQV